MRARHLDAGIGVSALAGAARRGVLVKGGIHLERMARVRVVAFDKTGAVTTGRLSLEAIEPLGGHSPDELLSVAASLESQSEHPVATAILASARDRGVALRAPTGVRALPGWVWRAGGRCAGGVRDAAAVRIARLAERRRHRGGAASRLFRHVAGRRRSKRRGDRHAGCKGPAKGRCTRVVNDLRAQGVSRVAMLTGDHEAAARATGSQVGMDDVRAAQLPEDKVSAVEELRHAHGAVAMVGDGVNDAPALAAADVGIVMGAMGSDAALETADIALMTDELPKLPYTIRLSHATLANIRANVALSIGLKLAFVILAVSGVATLWMAVLADTGASALVVANAVRLRKFE